MATKTFNRKVYQLDSPRLSTVYTAQNLARALRREGKLVRVTKVKEKHGMSFAVWYREKKR